MTNFTPEVTRRTFGTMLGASAAAVAAPKIVSAAVRQPRDETILELNSVPLAWPQYHRFASFAHPPKVGDDVTLKREERGPYEETAIAVYSGDWKRIGFVPRRHTPALLWAMNRGDVTTARVSHVLEPRVKAKPVYGWGSFHIDVRISAPALA